MSTTSHLGTLEIDLDDDIAWISFGHPQHNSLPLHLLHRMSDAIQECGDQQAKAIVLKSTGNRTFCAGANFDNMLSCQTMEEATAFFSGFGRLLNSIRSSDSLIIARLQGKAVGGGVGIAAATDYAMGTKWSSIRLSELFIGIGPYVIGPALERKIGLSAFSQLAINSSEWQTAQWARDKGLLHEVFDTDEHLDDYLQRFLERCREYTRESILNLKKVLWHGTDHWEELLTTRAKTSAQLLLRPETQRKIREMAARMKGDRANKMS